MSSHAYPGRAGMPAVVDAARRGDRAAMDELVSHCLPLVYNIVGRALNRSADVDDVVQNTMLNVVRGLPGVREPQLFRSWLVAVTMNEIRTHTQRRPTTPAPPEDIDNVIDPRADFEDLTLTQLGLADQRREVVLATRWLDDDHRHLLSLWWLVEAGHLTRADLVDALNLAPHHVTVRVSRMKAQLDTARLVVRALTARPGCAALADTATGWDRRPAPVWRKRFARHIRHCPHCPDATNDLVPAERLLANLALTPPPAALASDVTHTMHTVAAGSQGSPPGVHAVTAGARSGLSLSKTLVGVAAAAAVAVLGGGGLVLANYPEEPGRQPASAAAAQPSAATTAPALTPSSTTVKPSPTTVRPSPAPSRSVKPGKSPKPTPSSSPTRSAGTSTGLSAAERRLLVLLNERRRALGLTEVKLGTTQHRAAESCVRQNLNAGSGLTHCGHEVLFASSGTATPEQMIEAWFNSPGHKTALTYTGSRFAGPAIVSNGSRQVAAINIDY
ncbi:MULTISPECIES: sigma-70 family RNA polymerase sigma factor [unclassified Micromonospora]|uniref:sigma-70 family RNA polymerase sigma factor n=1 Tax=unclassified Micromonospora TaxID=2617518 RepID=UPI00259C7301|nr:MULTISPECIES: sigma-70 family RNA polymerase sigma factor [unclassified Micromonospora]MDM4778764.1 sigma-70 family RNA polymerase sigma factor [Micromonospora sp. b486]